MQIQCDTIINLLFIRHGICRLTLSRSRTIRTENDLAHYNLGFKINENNIILCTFQVQLRNSSENEQSNIIIFDPQLTSVLRSSVNKRMLTS